MSRFAKAAMFLRASIVHFTGFVNTLGQSIFPTPSHKRDVEQAERVGVLQAMYNK